MKMSYEPAKAHKTHAHYSHQVLECLYLGKLLLRDLFYEFLSGFLAAFLLGFQQVSCRLFCRYFADFDMKNEEIWQLLRKSEGGITC